MGSEGARGDPNSYRFSLGGSAMLDTVKDLLSQLSQHKDVVVPILSFLGGFVTLVTTMAARKTYGIHESHAYNHHQTALPLTSAPYMPTTPYPSGTSNWKRLGRIIVCFLVLSGCEFVLGDLRRQLFFGQVDPQQASMIGTACLLAQWIMVFLILLNALKIVCRLIVIAVR